MLDHFAAVIGPWIDILEGQLPNLSCILTMMDSTTATDWLRKSNFQECENEPKKLMKAKLEISRGHEKRILENNCTEYSQWFPMAKTTTSLIHFLVIPTCQTHN